MAVQTDKAARAFWRAFWRDSRRVTMTTPVKAAGSGGHSRLNLPSDAELSEQVQRSCEIILARGEQSERD